MDCFLEVAVAVFQSHLSGIERTSVSLCLVHFLTDYYYTKNDNSDVPKFSPWLKSVVQGKCPRSQFSFSALYQKLEPRTFPKQGPSSLPYF